MRMMNRRGLLRLFAGVAAACGFGVKAEAATTGRRYGAMTAERHFKLCRAGVHLHVFYRGRDVTTRCTFADDTAKGMSELLLKNADGKSYLRPIPAGEYGIYPGEQEIAKEIVYGVTFREGEPFA